MDDLSRLVFGVWQTVKDWAVDRFDPSWIEAGVSVLLVAVGFLAWLWRFLHRRADRVGGAPGVHVTTVRALDPGQFVGAYRIGDSSEYFEISHDQSVRHALDDRLDVLILGRPGIGKSHTAIHHIKCRLPDWHVIVPNKSAAARLSSLRLPRRRRYVLLLDDLNEYVEALADGEHILDVVGHLRRYVRDLVVVATLRTTEPEYGQLAEDRKLLGRWECVELTDWTLDAGRQLASLWGRDVENWDGTPLSAKRPALWMRHAYQSASDGAKSILRALRMLGDFGIQAPDRELVKSIYGTGTFAGVPQPFDSAVSEIDGLGFLKSATEQLEVYRPYLDVITDWAHTAEDDESLQSLLIATGRVDELVSVAATSAGRGALNEASSIYRQCIQLAPDVERLHYRLGVVLSRLRDWPAAALAFETATRLKPGWPTAWYRLARAYQESGRHSEGQLAFRRARRAAQLTAGGDSAVSSWLRTGKMLMLVGQVDDAIDIYREALAVSPDAADVYCALGIALRKHGNPQEAETVFRRALTLDQENAATHYSLGLTLISLDRFADAEASLRRALQLAPDWPDVRVALGDTLRELKQYKAAECEYRTLLTTKPAHVLASGRLANLLGDLKRYSEALDVLDAAEKHTPNSEMLRLGRGITLKNMERFSEAEQIFEALTHAHPSWSQPHSYLAGVLSALGRHKEAVRFEQRAIELGLTTAVTYYGLGFELKMLGDLPRAEQALRTAIEIDPRFAVAYSFLGGVLGRMNRWAESVELQRKAVVDLGLDTADAHFGLAMASLNARELHSAVTHLHRAIELKPSFGRAYALLGLVYSRQRRYKESIEAYQAAIAHGHDGEGLYVRLGVVLRSVGEFTLAERHYRTALTRDPLSLDARSRLAELLRETKRLKESVTVMQEGLRLVPDDKRMHFGLGLSLRALGRNREAEKAFREAIRLAPDFALAHSFLAGMLARLRRFDEARVSYERAVELDANRADYHIGLGRALTSAGQFTRAVHHLRRAIELDPTIRGGKTHLEAALRRIRASQPSKTKDKR